MKEKIEFSEFLEIEKKLEIQVGTIMEIEEVPKSSKLLKLKVRFSEEENRVVVTNIKPHLGSTIEDVMGRLLFASFLFVTNLKPTTIMGIESFAMILPGELEKGKLISVEGISITSPFQLGGTQIL